jgi:hypothetical protein
LEGVGYFSLATNIGMTQVHIYYGFQQNPLNLSPPPGKPEGNAVHGVHYAISPEIVLWVAAMFKCLQPRNEWEYGIQPCDIYLSIITSIYAKYPVILIHACKTIRSSYLIKHSSKI